jgi:hypothetical protein
LRTMPEYCTPFLFFFFFLISDLRIKILSN